MPDDDKEFERRMTAVVRVTTQDIAQVLKLKLTPDQRKAVSEVIEAGLYRWMDNEREMWSDDDDDDGAPGSAIDDPPAGNA